MATESVHKTIEPYAACSVQCYWENYNPNVRGEFENETLKQRNLKRMCDHIDACFTVGANSLPVRLVCFPEFGIGGLYNRNTTTAEVKQYQAITIPGPETDVLAEKARQYGIYIAACNHENDDDMVPDFFFNTAFVINPKGKIILKYRKLNAAFSCSPHDIYDKYINSITGTREFFPVVDTGIGNLACFICGDMGILEIPKIYAMKGAEVLCHLNSGYAHELARQTLRVRANDNTIYIVEENWAARVLTTERIGDVVIPTNYDTRGGGQSMIVGYRGNIISEANGTAPQLVTGMIDIMALRQNRQTEKRYPAQGMGDFMAQTRSELYAPFYNQTIFPPNRVSVDGPMTRMNDETVMKRRRQARDNRLQCYDIYSEDDVK